MRRWLRWPIAFLALSEAGYMALDRIRALVLGDYITPGSGRFVGRVGPWAAIVSAVGIPPRSVLMKGIFVGFGVAWLAILVAYVVHARWAWWAMVLAAMLSLWYLPIGTLLSAVMIVLLVATRRQRQA